MQPAHEGAHVGAQLGVELAEGLVEQQHAGAAQQGAGQRDALLLPARELVGPTGPEVVETDPAQHVGDLGPFVGPQGAGHPQPEPHVAGDVEVREEQRLLQHQPDRAALGRAAEHLDAVDAHTPGVGALQPREHPQRGALAAARGAQQGGEAAGLEVEVEVVDGDGLAEADHQVAGDHPGRGGGGVAGTRSGLTHGRPPSTRRRARPPGSAPARAAPGAPRRAARGPRRRCGRRTRWPRRAAAAGS